MGENDVFENYEFFFGKTMVPMMMFYLNQHIFMRLVCTFLFIEQTLVSNVIFRI